MPVVVPQPRRSVQVGLPQVGAEDLVLDVAVQRLYETVFGALGESEERSRRAAELSRQIALLARDGLGNGALKPGD
ncbi:hypothetical protein DIZ27_18990 [Streptomyces sp. NWU339]|uniref:hypothetical protein n=1 Tax=Streptomyces sp. NWU339 TaxID=2185284 RepID=UPI000D675AC7|nr:hypothetical protein [Streptomyces sp. NWU339]PWI09061.1 hypothetical protein DIZ27_18990 [Streptomyces sp. NWU339]